MKKRSIDIAIELVFVILVMIIVAIIVIKMFTSTSGQIKQLTTSQQQQIESYCISQEQENGYLAYCESTYSVGSSNLFEIANGLYTCGSTIECPVYMSFEDPNAVLYDNQYPVTPLLCIYLACQSYLNNGVDGPTATAEAFGQFYINMTPVNGGIDIYNNFPLEYPINISTETFGNIYYLSDGIIPTGISECKPNVPTWIQYEIFNGLRNLLNYIATQSGPSCQINLSYSTTSSGSYYLLITSTGSCEYIETTQESLCRFITSLPISLVARATELNS